MEQGYVSPRCLAGCENIMHLTNDTVPLKELGEHPFPDVQIASVLKAFGEDVPERIGGRGFSQFAVSKEKVRARQLEEWRALRMWLVETEVCGFLSFLKFWR